LINEKTEFVRIEYMTHVTWARKMLDICQHDIYASKCLAQINTNVVVGAPRHTHDIYGSEKYGLFGNDTTIVGP
jgi:hypothetical protein